MYYCVPVVEMEGNRILVGITRDVSVAVVVVGNGKLLAGSTSKRGKWTRTVEWTEKSA